jgi:hypothetical protein
MKLYFDDQIQCKEIVKFHSDIDLIAKNTIQNSNVF